jgi:predicted O-linked N-acetylglucosamine transferase (SPINDLY family)
VTDLLAVSLERARLRLISAIELIGTADRLSAAGTARSAATLYAEWIEHNPNDPLLYAIHFNLGVTLANLNEIEEAIAAQEDAIRLNPGFFPAYINLGMLLERIGRTADAVARWNEVVNRLGHVHADAVTHKTAALKQLGRVLAASHFDANAEEALRLSLDIAPHQRDVLQHWLSMRQRQCRWPVVAPIPGFTRQRIVAGMSPLTLAAYTDDPLLQLAAAADYARHDVEQPARTFASTHKRLLDQKATSRRRIGYLSSDLRHHAIGHLMAELFELHDRNAVEIVAYYCGPATTDAMHLKFRETADVWIDISSLTDEEAAQRISDDAIEILVDINGYTHSARTRILAMRPAPVIVNWLGYPATTGSPYHNYIIADDVIIPPDHEIFYSESVKRLPCYQPNNRRRIVAELTTTRHDVGLPDNGMVFCCFNAAHKITPFTWRRWMRILQNVPGSVLWMLSGVETTNERLLGHAVEQGVAAERIVLSPTLNNPLHLARYALADLFLDTSPYGAHTTASDALWMGVPVLTWPGRSFATRVCASLVSAAGLPELICRTGDEYVLRATELGNDRTRLEPLKKRLREGRDTCTLFDTPRLVSALERLFSEMWQEAVERRMPRPDLTNVEIYREIGAALDSDDVELAAVPHYISLYLAKLRERDEFGMIRPDSRLWRDTNIPVS